MHQMQTIVTDVRGVCQAAHVGFGGPPGVFTPNSISICPAILHSEAELSRVTD